MIFLSLSSTTQRRTIENTTTLKNSRFRSFKAKDSSVIREIHFVSNFNNEMLFAEFQSGAVYKYDNVPFVVYKALKTIRKTGSVGSLFNELVKDLTTNMKE